MKKNMKKVRKLGILLFLTIFTIVLSIPFAFLYNINNAEAGTFTAAELHLNRVQQSVASGIEYEIAFTTPAGDTGTDAEVHLILPTGDDTLWCRTAGALTAVGSTKYAINNLPGTLAATCAQTDDTITITGVTDLAAATEYGVKITDVGAGALGTPLATTTGMITIQTRTSGQAPLDSLQVAVDIITDDQVDVTATVPPSITFTLSANAIALGTLSTGSVSCDSHTIRIETNAVSGYSTEVYDDGNLRDNGNTVDDVGDGEVTIGQEEYGIGTTDSGQTIVQDATTCAGTALATGLDITTKTVAGEAVGPADETITVQYAASIDGTTVAGDYSHIVTYVTTGLF